jgi:hypothetical protein
MFAVSDDSQLSHRLKSVQNTRRDSVVPDDPDRNLQQYSSDDFSQLAPYYICAELNDGERSAVAATPMPANIWATMCRPDRRDAWHG